MCLSVYLGSELFISVCLLFDIRSHCSCFQGYETTCFETLTIPPPLDILVTANKEAELVDESQEPGTEAGEAGEGGGETNSDPTLPPLNPVSLSDAEARTSLRTLVSTHCCWGSGVVKQMRSDDPIFLPFLKSFC